MQSDRSNEVFTYWNGLRAGRAAPTRGQIDPAVLRRRLPDLFMLDCESTDWTFRLAGTRVCESFGRELHGERFLDLWHEPSRSAVTDAALTALRSEEAVTVEAQMRGELDSQACEILLLPVRSGTLFADRLLGSFVPLEPLRIDCIGKGAGLVMTNWLPCREHRPHDGEPLQPEPVAGSPSLLRRLADVASIARLLHR